MSALDQIGLSSYYSSMKEITTHYAKTHLSGLLQEVRMGETVIILQGRTPVGQLTAISGTRPPRGPKVGRPTSAPVRLAPDAFAPLSESELKAWGL
jgi:antitoxin (DNA-binding transcriptional repressor) of toxin-antitoxin stability system